MDFFNVFGISKITPILPPKRVKNDLKNRKERKGTLEESKQLKATPAFEVFLNSALEGKN